MIKNTPEMSIGALGPLVVRLLPNLRRWLTIWMAVSVLFALISLIEVAHTPEAGIDVAFRVTNVTAIILALVWLPALIAIFALMGGALKTPAGEASTPGLLSTLPKLIGTLYKLEPDLEGKNKQMVADIRREAEHEYGSMATAGFQTPSDLKTYANEYEVLRSTLPQSDERTFRMDTIVAQVRALASRARYSANDIRHLFNQGRDGDRLVALGLMQATPVKECFDLALDATGNSRSAFEQFHGLRAVETMLPVLGDDDIDALLQVFEDQKRKYLIPENRARWKLYEYIMEAIENRTARSPLPKRHP
jgi:hypothetical protein